MLDEGSPLRIGLGSLGDGYGVAVSGFAATAGFVYVADAGDDTVKVFDPVADPVSPVATIDGAGTPQEGFTDLTDSDLAIDDANGNLLVVDNLQPGLEHPAAAVNEFDAAGAYVGQIASWTDFVGVPPLRADYSLIHGGPSGVAVHHSANPDVEGIYITSGNDEDAVVYRFAFAAIANATLIVDKVGTGEGEVRSSSPGIACGSICGAEYETGREVSLTAAPKPHSAFIGWTVNGAAGACPGTGSCRVTMGAATAVAATFAATPQRSLTLAKTGSGTGSVTSSPVGLNCGGICSASFDQGAKVTLSAEAAPGSEFAGWSGACSGVENCEVTMGGDRAIGASFSPVERPLPPSSAQNPRVLSISVGGAGAGTITSDPAGIQCGTPCSGVFAPAPP